MAPGIVRNRNGGRPVVRLVVLALPIAGRVLRVRRPTQHRAHPERPERELALLRIRLKLIDCVGLCREFCSRQFLRVLRSRDPGRIEFPEPYGACYTEASGSSKILEASRTTAALSRTLRKS